LNDSLEKFYTNREIKVKFLFNFGDGGYVTTNLL
jgi:hypothetical protein